MNQIQDSGPSRYQMDAETALLQDRAYVRELRELQIELVKLLDWVRASGQRVVTLFEGRDTAGKGGAIFTFTSYLNPKTARIVALPAPSEVERSQWYFQRFLAALPNRGEMVFFDRSWYNRAVVEPVMGFCSEVQYELFMRQVVDVERLLADDGLHLTKLWFSIGPEEQQRRLALRSSDPLRRWKLSTVDSEAQQRWDDFTRYKEAMFARTHTEQNPWWIVLGNDKRSARLESIRLLLSRFDYTGKQAANCRLEPDPAIVSRWRSDF